MPLNSNVSPCVKGRTVSRDDFTVLTSENSHSQVNKDMVHFSLFCSHFSSRKPVCSENYCGVGHAIDRFVVAIARRFSGSPLLNRGCESLFEARCARGEALSPKNMTSSLEGDSNIRNTHSESFAERRRGPLTWRRVFSAPWRAFIFQRHHPPRLRVAF